MRLAQTIQAISNQEIAKASDELATIAQSSLEELYLKNRELLLEEVEWQGELDTEIKKFSYEPHLSIMLQENGVINKKLRMTLEIIYEGSYIGYYQYITDLDLNYLDEYFVLR